jgi:hypothetical protein
MANILLQLIFFCNTFYYKETDMHVNYPTATQLPAIRAWASVANYNYKNAFLIIGGHIGGYGNSSRNATHQIVKLCFVVI